MSRMEDAVHGKQKKVLKVVSNTAGELPLVTASFSFLTERLQEGYSCPQKKKKSSFSCLLLFLSSPVRCVFSSS